MRRSLLLATVILSSLIQVSTSLAQNVSSNTEDLIRRSKYIFKGRVEKIHASNLKSLTATDNTAVVLVEEVLYAPPTLNDFTRQRITVQLVSPSSLRAGAEAVFFTNGWLYGETIAVIEVAHVSARVDSNDLRKQIAEVYGRMDEEKLRSRIEKAAVVIAGKVTATRPLKDRDRARFITEHDPDWWQAEIEVQSVEKGQLPNRKLTILFPDSLDEMWLLSPKFKPGDTGVWILQRDQKERGFPVLRVPGLTALDRLDFQPVSELERIRRIITTR